MWLVPSDFGSALQGFTKLLGAPGDGRGLPLRAVAGGGPTCPSPRTTPTRSPTGSTPRPTRRSPRRSPGRGRGATPAPSPRRSPRAVDAAPTRTAAARCPAARRAATRPHRVSPAATPGVDASCGQRRRVLPRIARPLDADAVLPAGRTARTDRPRRRSRLFRSAGLPVAVRERAGAACGSRRPVPPMPSAAVHSDTRNSSGLTLPVRASPRITTAAVPGSRPTRVASMYGSTPHRRRARGVVQHRERHRRDHPQRQHGRPAALRAAARRATSTRGVADQPAQLPAQRPAPAAARSRALSVLAVTAITTPSAGPNSSPAASVKAVRGNGKHRDDDVRGEEGQREPRADRGRPVPQLHRGRQRHQKHDCDEDHNRRAR